MKQELKWKTTERQKRLKNQYKVALCLIIYELKS